jgi:Zn-dependent protease with chaperone function
MNISELRSPKERTLYVVALIFALIIWIAIVVSIVGLVYALLGAVFYLIVRAVVLATIKGNGVRVTAQQLPELYKRLEAASQKLGLKEPPETYLVNQRGIFNAFATRFLGRNFIVLYAELAEACDQAGGGLDFIIGHEVGHHAFGHLRRLALLLPAHLVPLLGPAYSRACEYSCDRAGQAACDDPQAAITGLLVLAAGGRYAKQLNLDAYLEQRLTTGTFWQAIVELNMSHPFLSKRIGALIADKEPAKVKPVGRNPFAYPLAPFFAFAGAGAGGAGSAIIIVAIMGVLAAIAIPKYESYVARSRQVHAAAALGGGGGVVEDAALMTPDEMIRRAQQGQLSPEQIEALMKRAQEEARREAGLREEALPAGQGGAVDAQGGAASDRPAEPQRRPKAKKAGKRRK